MYGILVEDDFALTRDELAAALADGGVETRTFFCPMNMQPFLRSQRGFRDVPCPVAEELWRAWALPALVAVAERRGRRGHCFARLTKLAAVRS